MNKQRKILITVTYNELGIIIDTKAEELDSSARPDVPDRNVGNTEITEEAVKEYCRKRCLTILTNDYFYKLTSAQPEIVRCKDCKHRKFVDFGMGDCLHPSGCRGIAFDNHFCALGERRDRHG